LIDGETDFAKNHGIFGFNQTDSGPGKWRFPEIMGVPLVRIGFPIINQQFWGSPIVGKPHI